MSKIFVNIGLSLDGYMAPEGMRVIDELEIALAPILFNGGRRLFENLNESVSQFRIDNVLEGPAATHLRYVRE